MIEDTGLYSGLGRKLFTVVEDTCGFHDTIGGCCSAEINELRYGVPNTPNCRDNFLRALAPFGLGLKDIVANVNNPYGVLGRAVLEQMKLPQA